MTANVFIWDIRTNDASGFVENRIIPARIINLYMHLGIRDKIVMINANIKIDNVVSYCIMIYNKYAMYAS